MSGTKTRTQTRIRNGVVGGVLAAVALCGGTAAASTYPPGDVPVTTTHAGGVSDPADPGASQLPATGSDTGTAVKLAGGAILAGAGLLVTARRRRRPIAS